MITLETFSRRFEFSLPEITFSGMCVLNWLINELNSWEYFAHFQKYLWRRAVVQRQRATMEGNQRLMVIGDNRDNLVFSQGKIFSSYGNIIIPCVRSEYFCGNLDPKSILKIQYSQKYFYKSSSLLPNTPLEFGFLILPVNLS